MVTYVSQNSICDKEQKRKALYNFGNDSVLCDKIVDIYLLELMCI